MIDIFAYDEWLGAISKADLSARQKGAHSWYVTQLQTRGSPVVWSVTHLAALVGVPVDFLYAASLKSELFYEKFTLPKRTGGLRTISAPKPELMLVQDWILKSILERQPVHEAAFAYRQGISAIDHALCHLGQPSLAHVDIQDFFPSIGVRRIIKIFRRCGYGPDLGRFLGLLCTSGNRLPQGASTSPMLSNLVLAKLDRRLFAYATRRRLRYTRYADDIFLSGASVAVSHWEFAKTLVADEGFVVNHDKSYLKRNRSKKIVTGVSIGAMTARLPKVQRRQTRALVTRLVSSGVRDYVDASGEHDALVVERALGKLNYWLQIEPNNIWALQRREEVRALLQQQPKG